MGRYSYYLRIAGVTVCLETDRCLPAEEAFVPFITDKTVPDLTAVLCMADALPPVPEQVVYEDLCYRIHPDGKGGFMRTFFDAPRDLTPYAAAVYDFAGGKIFLDYLEKGAHCLSQMHNTFFHLSFETVLLHHSRLCLHAACVETPLGGIVFSGPSGIGKSTQAENWCRFRGARQINGDRPILSAEKEGWRAWGSPYAGSSKCHVNESCAVAAIVVLRQAKENSLRRMEGAEAFRALWQELTLPTWDPQAVEKGCDLLLELLDRAPVFEFACTPDQTAVDFLDNGLRKECSL